MARADDEWVQDIISAIADIRADTTGLDFAAFAGKPTIVRSVLYSIAIMGEATKGISRGRRRSLQSRVAKRRARGRVRLRPVIGIAASLRSPRWALLAMPQRHPGPYCARRSQAPLRPCQHGLEQHLTARLGFLRLDAFRFVVGQPIVAWGEDHCRRDVLRHVDRSGLGRGRLPGRGLRGRGS